MNKLQYKFSGKTTTWYLDADFSYLGKLTGQEQTVLGVTGGFIGAGVANDAKGLSQELGGAWVVGVGALPGEGLCGEVDRGFRNAAKGGYFLRGLGPIRRCEKEWIGNVRMCE